MEIAVINNANNDSMYVMNVHNGSINCNCGEFVADNKCQHIVQVEKLLYSGYISWDKTKPVSICKRCGIQEYDIIHPNCVHKYCQQCEWYMSGGMGIRPFPVYHGQPETVTGVCIICNHEDKLLLNGKCLYRGRCNNRIKSIKSQNQPKQKLQNEIDIEIKETANQEIELSVDTDVNQQSVLDNEPLSDSNTHETTDDELQINQEISEDEILRDADKETVETELPELQSTEPDKQKLIQASLF